MNREKKTHRRATHVTDTKLCSGDDVKYTYLNGILYASNERQLYFDEKKKQRQTWERIEVYIFVKTYDMCLF